MRNDKKGKVLHDSTLGIYTFYASGERGNEVRADGYGGSLARGYYAISDCGPVVGPATCRKAALMAHFVARREGAA